MATSSLNWKPDGRPMSTIVLNFSAALDDLFNLGSISRLNETTEEKSREVNHQKAKLEDLETQVRRADEELNVWN